MGTSLFVVSLVIVTALMFDFTNGFHDSANAMATSVATGALKRGVVDIQSPQGFAAETSSAVTILASSHLGFGLSTTQVCAGGIIGSGLGRNRHEVRWSTARKMLYAWLLTLPAAALVGGIAAAVADTGALGTVVIFVVLLASAFGIWVVSRRNAVTSTNVNDARDVTLNPEPVPVAA
jgi:PiT family inorganic phosphate transporter